jgi:hypothetical protein
MRWYKHPIVLFFLTAIGIGSLHAQRSVPPASGGRKTQKGLRPPAHDKTPAIYLLADGRKDSVILRWVPGTDVLWKMGNKYGYIVERFTAMKDGRMIPEGSRPPKLLTVEPLRPWSHRAMTQLVDRDEYAGVVDEAIYGADFNVKMKSESPKEVLAQVQQAQNRFGFALLVCDFSPAVAHAAALRLVDRKTVAGEKYIYRVRIAMPDSLKHIVTYKPGITMLGPEEMFLRPSIRGLKAQFGDRAAALSWNQEMLHGVYTAYYIERSFNGGPFVRLNQHPYLQMTTSGKDDKFTYYVDSLPANGMPCAYRITGITPFGDTGAWSDTVRGSGVVKMDYRPFFDSVYLAANGSSAVIKWTLPDSIRREITGIYVARAPKNQGPYTNLNDHPYSPGQTQTVDPLVTGTSNYYRLRLVKKNGSEISSLPYYLPKQDSIPPAVPSGLAGASDRRGIARIHWRPDTEKDLKGYRLFRSQVRDGEYMEITHGPTTDTAFTDTLNLGFTNPFVYYRVLALDHYYNSSDYSAPLAIRRPDTVPPAPAVITGLRRADTVVYLSWVGGSSPDVQQYSLYRIDKEKGDRELVAVFPAAGVAGLRDATTCTDEPSTTTLGHNLVYEIAAEDSAGNRSVVHSGELYYETGFRKPVLITNAVALRDQKTIRLTWRYDLPGVTGYVVYRAVNNEEKYVSYALLPGNVSGYEDRGLHISNTYKYKIKAVMNNGIESKLTGETTVVY